MTTHARATTQPFSIRRLRALILVALLVGVSVYTGVMFTLVQRLSERFGPEVRADLDWRALRGAQELAKTADVGLAVSDTAMVTEAFGAYATASDVQAIVAVDASGKVVAVHGAVVDPASLFSGDPGQLVVGSGYLVSWAPADIEGKEVGKVAVVVSTQRLTDGQSLLDTVSWTTVVAGLASLVLGGVVVLFFTRAVSIRDGKLNDYAHNLEQKVEARTRELDARNRGMRLVLDNVAQGFITVDLDGKMDAERSAIVDRWFGVIIPGTTFGELVQPHDASYPIWFGLGLDALRRHRLPLALCLDQLPPRFVIGARTFQVTYSALGDEPIRHLLLIVSDVTTQVAREREQCEQRELVAIFQRITADRPGFEEFLSEASSLVDLLAGRSDPVVEKRAVHTLKGNCAIYGLETFSLACHTVESELEDSGEPISETQRQVLIGSWRTTVDKIGRLLGDKRRDVVEIEPSVLARLIERVTHGVPSFELVAVLTSWLHEPLTRHLERLGNHAQGLARRLGKGEIVVTIDDATDIRLEGQHWAPFWAAMVHAVRNSVDHGFESSDLREAAGKSACGRLTLSAALSHGHLVIAIADDGGGIDWDAVHSKAIRAGLPAGTPAALVDALFTDGVSTRVEASEISGRGIGLAALREAVLALGGTIEVVSTKGRGTSFVSTFPFSDAYQVSVSPPSRPLQRLA